MLVWIFQHLFTALLWLGLFIKTTLTEQQMIFSQFKCFPVSIKLLENMQTICQPLHAHFVDHYASLTTPIVDVFLEGHQELLENVGLHHCNIAILLVVFSNSVTLQGIQPTKLALISMQTHNFHKIFF